MPAVLLKTGLGSLAKHLHCLMNICWLSQSVPQGFKDAKITTLYKNKGERGDCNTYCGISLLSVTSKVIPKLLLKRLQQVADIIYPESQYGFWTQRSTTDMIFAVRQLMKESREQRTPLFLAFADLTKILNLVDQKALFTVLAKAGCPPTLVALIRSLHDGMFAKVQFDDHLSETFSIRKGVKQRCVLAPTLVGMYFSYVFKKVHANLNADAGVSLLSRDDGNFFNLARLRARTKVQKFAVHELLYADDATLCASSHEQLQNFLNSFSDAYDHFGVTMGLKKIVTLSQSPRTPTFTINQNQLKDVDRFTHLGSTLTKK